VPTTSIRKIDSITIGSRHRRELGNIRALADSIERVGLLHPPVILQDGTLVAGERRLAALRMLGRESCQVTIVENLTTALDILYAERDENTERLDFAPTEAVALGRVIEPREREEAAERQKATRAEPGEAADKRGAKFPPRSREGKSRDKVAAAVGMSAPTLKRATEIVEAAEAEPEKFGALAEEMDRTRRVNGVYRKLKTARAAEKVRELPQTSVPTDRRYGVIVADPPWMFDARADDQSHRAANPYPSMSLDDIKALKVPSAEDCVLWLWTTNSHMEHSFGVARAWGFEPKTILTWVKPKMGLGDYLRNITEHCLLCVCGHPPLTLTNQTTVLSAPSGPHSRKPNEFFALAESLCPDRRRLEMFAREARDGWDSWGSEL
jgi:N6-adenosine-specific RNA methylase IME4/ParB-like chromosome segregation protein Spo0J